MNLLNNKIGLRFGKLTIAKIVEVRNNRRIYQCLCDCGNIIQRRSDNLRSNSSCGCALGKSDGVAALNYVISYYKSNAKRKNIKFLLSRDICVNLLLDNCYYCGEKPTNTTRRKGLKTQITYNGIDRLYNNLGYIKNNVVTCCKECNYLKSDMNHDYFMNKIEKIYNTLKAGL